MKTKVISWFSFWLLIGALTSCVQYEDDYISKYCPGSCTVVTGRVTTADGTRPLQNVTLTALWKNTPYLGGGTIRKKAVARTDSEGYYTLRFLLRDNELENGYITIEPEVDHARYMRCRVRNEQGLYQLSREASFVVDYYFPEIAYLTLKIDKGQGMQPDDRLAVSVLSGPDEELRCENHVAWTSSTDVNQTVIAAAESPVLLHITRTKGGLITYQTDTLYLTPGELRTHTLTF